MPLQRIAVLFALAALGACAGRQAQPAAAEGRAQAPTRQQRIHAALAQSLRVVLADEGKAVRSASGVTIGSREGPDGAVSYVVTNAHVVAPREGEEPLYFVLLELPDGEARRAAASLEALGEVPDADLAVLSVRGVRLPAATLADDEELSVGDEVFVVAAPYGRALSVSGGLVSQIDFERGATRVPTMVKTDAAIGYGASGGGIFSAATGKLLGIVEGYRTAKVTIPLASEAVSFDLPMPGETFAAPAAKVRRFLGEKGLLDQLTGAGEALTAARAK
ncbi:MAG: S1C family serine protease [Myxococcales bacterium]|jgi:serine protease Do